MPELRSALNGGDDVVVIAEAGVNHNGEERLAHELIDVAAAAGAHFVKFQTFVPEKLVAEAAEATPYQQAQGGASSQSELLRALALPERVWPELRDHAHAAGIGFLSTPFDLDSAELLVDLGVDALKVSSGELTNHPFLSALARLDVALLVSTGMGDAAEVASAVEACSAAPFLALFHCVSAYPAPEAECNLAAIPALARQLGVPVGWSDHTVGAASALIAAALGARLSEKPFTIGRSLPGPDHAASAEPRELSEYVRLVTSVPAMVGDGVKRRMPSEEENAPLVRRSWHARNDLPAGHILTAEDLLALRPEAGVPPTQRIEGRALRTAVAAGSPITLDALSREG